MKSFKFYSYTILLITAFIYSCNELKNPCNLVEYYSLQLDGLQLTECGTGEGQTTIYSKYTIYGKQSHQLEKQLVKKYGMGQLTFTCCGWEPKNGKLGQKYIDLGDSSRVLTLNMWSKLNENDSNQTSNINRTRTERDTFYLEVKLMEI
jgi:hypothetical protein